MHRREFITLLGGVAAAWPLAAKAQQTPGKRPRIGAIHTFRSENSEAFIQGLREAGLVDGQNMFLEVRFSGGALDRVDELARELVAINCNVIFAGQPLRNPRGNECDQHNPSRRS